MAARTLDRIEADISRLSVPDQLRLMETLAHRIRERAFGVPTIREGDLAAMASDPDIQRELRLIEAEFAVTELDGLDVEME